ncbi:MAG TPA: glycine betaine ABC transporter substrate-binding protein [Pseudomonadales bacterium]|nr:glycine betaine ABC transporter substrate-binding protein [Pseudomonadales bacterium]
MRTAAASPSVLARTVLVLLLIGLLPCATRAGDAGSVSVGSKNFNESYLLGEITAQLLEGAGFEVARRFGLGGTLICYEALIGDEIDVYVEYTGTITQTILASPVRGTREAITAPLAALGLRTLPELGFDNTYALAMDGERAQAEGIERISDLVGRTDLLFAFSHEFIDRDDGWRGLRQVYGFEQTPTGIEHGLAYQAIANDSIDVTDAYSTDGDLQRFGLRVLEDDRGFFPRYAALPLVREDFPDAAARVIAQLDGRIDAARMRRLNAQVVVEQRSFAAVAAEFLAEEGLTGAGGSADAGLRSALIANTAAHLRLTGVALLLAVLVGLPLGILVHRSRRVSRVVLYVAGLLQTIPSIALLALLIPVLGIGWAPAVVALFLYSLLPILRSTVTALLTVDPLLRRVAVGMGLTPVQQIRWLLLPMALPNVLAGIRTAAVISIGTATLAAFVGAGGLGQPIVTGLALNDPGMILEGAVPAAGLALLTELSFEWLERRLIPAHLREDPLR